MLNTISPFVGITRSTCAAARRVCISSARRSRSLRSRPRCSLASAKLRARASEQRGRAIPRPSCCCGRTWQGVSCRRAPLASRCGSPRLTKMQRGCTDTNSYAFSDLAVAAPPSGTPRVADADGAGVFSVAARDNGDGSFTVTYETARAGAFLLHVMHGTQSVKSNIRGSPFLLKVSPRASAAHHCELYPPAIVQDAGLHGARADADGAGDAGGGDGEHAYRTRGTRFHAAPCCPRRVLQCAPPLPRRYRRRDSAAVRRARAPALGGVDEPAVAPSDSRCQSWRHRQWPRGYVRRAAPELPAAFTGADGRSYRVHATCWRAARCRCAECSSWRVGTKLPSPSAARTCAAPRCGRRTGATGTSRLRRRGALSGGRAAARYVRLRDAFGNTAAGVPL